MLIVSQTKINEKTGYDPHIGQKHVDAHFVNHGFNWIFFGRRTGKTWWVEHQVKSRLFRSHETMLHVGPTYKVAKLVWQPVLNWVIRNNQDKAFDVSKAEFRIHNKRTDTTFQLGSADNPTSMLGTGNTWVSVDEAARIPELVFTETLYPTLMDNDGTFVGISTPKGKGFAYQEYLRGQDPNNSKYFSTRLPTWINPKIKHDRLVDAFTNTPEEIFRQEYMAEFIDDAGSVFRNIQACATAQYDYYIFGHRYVFAVDLAKKQDFTVIMVADRQSRAVVYFERFNQISWPMQLDRIINVSRMFNNCPGIIDSTGLGDVVYDDLTHRGIHVRPFNFGSGGEKNRIIENLSAAMDKIDIHYPTGPDPRTGCDFKIAMNELDTYEYEIMPATRKFRYNAPPGLHDDTVVTLAMIVEALDTAHIAYSIASDNVGANVQNKIAFS